MLKNSFLVITNAKPDNTVDIHHLYLRAII